MGQIPRSENLVGYNFLIDPIAEVNYVAQIKCPTCEGCTVVG